MTLKMKVHGLEVGADGHLSQRFEMQELIATIHALIRLNRAELAMQSRTEELLETSRRKNEFLAMLAHELRNRSRRSREQRTRAIECGFDHHLVKPVVTKLIESFVADLTHTRESSHRLQSS